jgi:hypothetical protein
MNSSYIIIPIKYSLLIIPLDAMKCEVRQALLANTQTNTPTIGKLWCKREQSSGYACLLFTEIFDYILTQKRSPERTPESA